MELKTKRYLMYFICIMFTLILFTNQIHVYYVYSLVLNLAIVMLLNEILLKVKGEKNEETTK